MYTNEDVLSLDLVVPYYFRDRNTNPYWHRICACWLIQKCSFT